MQIVKIPDGETKESFIKCRILNIERQLDLYTSIAQDLSCYDTDTQINIIAVESQLLGLLHHMKEIKI